MLASLNTARDTRTEAPSEKVIIDKGEQVHTNTSHHVHHLVQPVIERDTHEHHKTHTGTYSSFTSSTSPRIDQFLSSKFSVVPDHQESLRWFADKYIYSSQCGSSLEGSQCKSSAAKRL